MSMPTVRPAASDAELNAIAELIQQVFQSDETTRAHRLMTAMPGFDPASLPTVWDDRGHPIATVQAVPCEAALLGVWLPAGIITMVATAEQARGHGYMRACMEAAHRWMLDHGRSVGVLYGVPSIYPKFGYRPLMPRCETRYPLPGNGQPSNLRPAGRDDAASLARLFNDQEQARPGAVKRGEAGWIWQSPTGRTSILCLEADGMVRGYLSLLTARENGTVTVVEAACTPDDAANLLDNLHGWTSQQGAERITLRLMPDHPLVLEVTRRVLSLSLDGVEQLVIPPQAGMLAILDSAAVLQKLAPEIERRLEGRSLRITDGAGLNLQFGDSGGSEIHLNDSPALSQLLAGYPGARALRQWGALDASRSSLALAEGIFPTSWPRWGLAPFWDE